VEITCAHPLVFTKELVQGFGCLDPVYAKLSQGPLQARNGSGACFIPDNEFTKKGVIKGWYLIAFQGHRVYSAPQQCPGKAQSSLPGLRH
jgi:hypothetical protein